MGESFEGLARLTGASMRSDHNDEYRSFVHELYA